MREPTIYDHAGEALMRHEHEADSAEQSRLVGTDLGFTDRVAKRMTIFGLKIAVRGELVEAIEVNWEGTDRKAWHRTVLTARGQIAHLGSGCATGNTMRSILGAEKGAD